MNFLFSTQKNPYGLGPIGGAESSMKLIASEMAKKGHVVVYLTKNVTAQSRNNANKCGIKLVSYVELPRGRRFYLIKLINNGLKLSAAALACFKWKVDIVYFFYEKNLVLPILKVRSLYKRPKFVLRMAGLSWYEQCLDDKSDIKRYQKIFNEVDSINFIHKALLDEVKEKSQYLEMSFSQSNFFFLDIGGDIKKIKHECRKFRDDRDFEIVMASRFTGHQKRQDILLHAISLIPSSYRVRITFIGDGEKLDSIKRLAVDLGVEERVVFSGFMDQKSLWEVLVNADLLCHSTESEGLGKIIIESMAIGLPVLASRVVSIKDYVEDGCNGFLVNNEPDLWADKIVSLMDDPETLEMVSRNSIDFVMKNYDKEKNIVSYEEEFAKLLSS